MYQRHRPILSQLYICKNTSGLKYTGDSVVQVRTFINFLTSEFSSSTRGERDTILNYSILTKLKRSAHLIDFKISVGRDLPNSMIRLQLLNYGDFIIPRKARFIPTFCKRINRTLTALEIWVRAFEERKTNDLYVQQNLYTTTTTTIINRVLHQME